MCGILAQFSNEKIDINQFEYKLSKIDHRGIDGRGILNLSEEKVFLGHTRLSFFDLSESGSQPFSKDYYHIIFNGEIYNHKDIREELIENGANFSSKTDTEVILLGYIQYGDFIFNKLEGMFSVVIFNSNTNEVIVARDIHGIKPLYYRQNENGITFGSELKVFEDEASQLSLEAKVLFLLLGFVPEPMTIYKEVFAFKAGIVKHFCSDSFIETSSREIIYDSKNLDEITVNEQFFHSVTAHLKSDVPVGVFLSGGLDSSSFVSVAKNKLKTVSIYFDDENFSERKYQNIISESFNTEHFEMRLTKTIFRENLNKFIDAMDSPTIDGFNTFMVSKLAKESGIKACLSGVGADEILYGYPSFKRDWVMNALFKLPSYLIKQLAKLPSLRKLEYLELKDRSIAKYLVNRSLYSPLEISKLLGVKTDFVYQCIDELSNIYGGSEKGTSLQTVSYLERNLYMKNQLLRDADVFGMANSVEIRVPFLDNKLSELVGNIPDNEKMSRKYNKPVLVKIVYEKLNREIFERKKAGFEIPYKDWILDIPEIELLPTKVKSDFINGKVHWSKAWSLIVLNKFEEKVNYVR